MFEPKLISPLLDGFVMGEPMSSHDGVICCPAMKENSGEKYIVKIISVPASQRQLDALLLTGAYQNAASAMEYFRELAEGVIHEAELLQHLSKLEGYLPYEAWQMVPMEDGRLGYHIYMLSPYKRSLEKHLRRSTMTHLGAVNLGLDLCEALAVCRRAGHLCIDLKPSNIFLAGQTDFRIGDLGFARLEGLKFASLPSKYRSCYTPPELHDELATLNPTMDVYAVGLILYQIFNNNTLPFQNRAPQEALPAPLNADYEMAEIILKACAPDPKERWQNPVEMGQALVAYLQRNVINDTPLIPPTLDKTEDVPTAQEDIPAADETVPDGAEGNELDETDVSDELQSMLSQADALLAHEAPSDNADSDDESAENASGESADEEPDSFLAPSRDSQEDDDYDDDDDDYDDYDDEDDDYGDEDASEFPSDVMGTPRKRNQSWITVVILLLILGLLGGGGYYFYQNYYVQTIDSMHISGFENTLTIELSTQVDESLLTVICTDTYGNTKTQPISGGKATFLDLSPDTNYKVHVEMEGFHRLVGSTFGSYTTAKQTNIVSFTAVTGNEDGSVILNFTVNGPETQDWVIDYVAEGEEAKTHSVTGHMATITGLTVGKNYTFTLNPAPGVELYLVGTNKLEFLASKIAVAENLAIVSCKDGVLTAQWDAPADAAVSSWSVRCYSSDGYDKTIQVTDTTAQFPEISPDKAYTVDVTAAGMTQTARAYVTANPITVDNIQVVTTDPTSLTVNWDYSGTAPTGGWLLLYNFAGSDTQEVVKCSSNSAVIPLHIANAAYELTIQAADGATVFGGTLEMTTPAAAAFDRFALPASKIDVKLCKRPEKENWTYKDVANADYVTTFASEEKTSLVLHAKKQFYTYREEVTLRFVIRDAEGHVIPSLIHEETRIWQSMWKNYYAGINIPKMPTKDGSYTMELYFNNCFVTSLDFSISGSG